MKTLLTASALCIATFSYSQSNSDWTFGGYFDTYFQYDFGRPTSGDNVNGRGFDIAHSRLRLAVGQLDISKAATPWGATIQLYGGKNSDIIHLAEPGGMDTYSAIRQAYVTYAPQESGWTFDFGKFDTWIGYEGIDNRYQDQYSRSFNWTYSEPTYETGLRATGKISPQVNLSLFLVQGWNEVEDGNNSPSMGAQLTFAAGPKTTIVLQNHYGDEGSDDANDVGTFGGIGFPNPGTSKVHLFDAIVTHQLDPKTKIAYNLDIADSSGGTNDGQWSGHVLYLRHQASDTRAYGLRFEQVNDDDGLRTGVSDLRMNSITGGYDLSVHKNATLRIEIRHDMADQAFFNSSSGLRKNRTTLTVGAIVKL